MGVYKRVNTWTAHVNWRDHSGKRQQKTKGGFRTKKEAEAFHRDFLSAVASGRKIASPKTTFEDFLLNRWLPDHSKRVRPSTAESYRSSLTAYVIPVLGKMRLDEIRTVHLEAALNELWATGRKADASSLSPKTIANIFSIVKRALRDAVRWELIAFNPAESVQLPRRQRKEVKALSPADLGRYLAHVQDHRFGPIYQLTCLTGMRRGEILGLRWEDVDLENQTVSIRRSRHRVGAKEVIEHPKTDKARRTISIDSDTISKLKTWRARQNKERLQAGQAWLDDHGYVVTREDGSLPSISSFYRTYKQTIISSGVDDITFHGLRHSYVTAALLANSDLKTVSQRVGHSETSVTVNTYYHVIRGQDQLVAEQAAQSILKTAR